MNERVLYLYFLYLLSKPFICDKQRSDVVSSLKRSNSYVQSTPYLFDT